MLTENYKFNPEQVTYFAYTKQHSDTVAFGIKAKDRLHHMYIIGKTGMGKSSLLENIAIQDILNDDSIVFIDPHGNSAERLLRYVPKHRLQDVIYFNPQDVEYPIGFNILESVREENRHILVSSIISIFKKIWSDAWSSRMEYILQNALLALTEFDGATLLDINKILSNKDFRDYVLSHVKDPVVQRFWKEEFGSYSERYAQESVPAIQNKIGQLISNPLIRNIIGQKRSTFYISEFIQNRKILILNLSKGAIGEDSAKLLGSLVSIKLYLTLTNERQDNAFDQSDIHPIYLFVDEFHSISNDVFKDMLSEARKYKLSVTIAHQYLAQLDDNIREAIFGNVGTNIAFRVGVTDAEVLEHVFAPNINKDNLQSLEFSEIALNLSIDGVTSPAFFAKTIPPIEEAPYDFSDEVKEISRSRYGMSKQEVEKSILKSVSFASTQKDIHTNKFKRGTYNKKTISQRSVTHDNANADIKKISNKIKTLMQQDYSKKGSSKVADFIFSGNSSIKEMLRKIMKRDTKKHTKDTYFSAEKDSEKYFVNKKDNIKSTAKVETGVTEKNKDNTKDNVYEYTNLEPQASLTDEATNSNKNDLTEHSIVKVHDNLKVEKDFQFNLADSASSIRNDNINGDKFKRYSPEELGLDDNVDLDSFNIALHKSDYAISYNSVPDFDEHENINDFRFGESHGRYVDTSTNSSENIHLYKQKSSAFKKTQDKQNTKLNHDTTNSTVAGKNKDLVHKAKKYINTHQHDESINSNADFSDKFANRHSRSLQAASSSAIRDNDENIADLDLDNKNSKKSDKTEINVQDEELQRLLKDILQSDDSIAFENDENIKS